MSEVPRSTFYYMGYSRKTIFTVSKGLLQGCLTQKNMPTP